MIKAVSDIKGELLTLRNDFDNVLTCVIERIDTLDLDPLVVPRQRRPPLRFSGPAATYVAETVSDHYRPMYFAVLDEAIVQLTDRFSGSGLKQYGKLETVLLTGDVTGHEEQLEAYPEIDVRDLAAQLRMFMRTRQIASVNAAATVLYRMLPEVRAEYDQVCQLVKLLLVSPASSAQAERSFSALRRLKTWLRSTMTEKRLNSVAVCHTHQQLLDELDSREVAADFASVCESRRSVFGRFS